MQKKTCLVTGGAGFIGSNVCDALVKKGFRVVCLDSLITGSKENLSFALQSPDFVFIQSDVTQQIPVVGTVDYIFHLASPASVIDYQKFPKETALVNSFGTMQLLDVAKAHKAKFLFTSTSEVYGNPKIHPQKETYWGNVNPIGARACYDEAKRWGEMITMLYHRQQHVDTRIVRIFNTYGPRMRPTDGRVVSNFINQAIRNQPLTVYGTGKQTRSFCFISDMVSGILAAMFSEHTTGEVFNLGNPDEYHVIDFAKIILQQTDSKSKIIYNKLPEDDPEVRQPDITKAVKTLGWKPLVALTDGLSNTIEYYRSLI